MESKVSEGTTFIIELDRKPGEVQETETSLSVLPDEVIADCQILLCEDNQINSLVVRKLLEKKGCTLTIAENGQRGVELFSASAPGQYAAILMDIRMPVMNGLEAARAIRALNRTDADSVPIIAMSANAFAEDVQKSLDAGMNAHLSKPVDAQMMYETLAAHIAR